jgi:hypothetical protein
VELIVGKQAAFGAYQMTGGTVPFLSRRENDETIV